MGEPEYTCMHSVGDCDGSCNAQINYLRSKCAELVTELADMTASRNQAAKIIGEQSERVNQQTQLIRRMREVLRRLFVISPANHELGPFAKPYGEALTAAADMIEESREPPTAQVKMGADGSIDPRATFASTRYPADTTARDTRERIESSPETPNGATKAAESMRTDSTAQDKLVYCQYCGLRIHEGSEHWRQPCDEYLKLSTQDNFHRTIPMWVGSPDNCDHSSKQVCDACDGAVRSDEESSNGDSKDG